MNFHILVFSAFLFANTFCFAEGDFKILGARATGMGGASVTFSDQWSAGNNQAGNVWSPGISCGIFYENRFLARELSYQALCLTLNGKPGAFSAVCTHFRTSVYNETKAGCSYSRKFGNQFSAGVQLDYYRFQIADGYGMKNLFNCELGLMFRPDRHWTAGFQCVNPAPVKVLDEPLPAFIRLGLSYFYSDALILSAEIEKDFANKPTNKDRCRISLCENPVGQGRDFHGSTPIQPRCRYPLQPFLV